MKIKQKFLKEIERFEKFSNHKYIDRTEIGLNQFYLKESKGIIPKNPDEYYLILLNGKKWWEWHLNYLKEQYMTNDWPGWIYLKEQYKDDINGYKQIRLRLKSTAKNFASICKISEKQFEEIWRFNNV